MELILLRHGRAEERNASGDAARVLVDKGRQQARRAGLLLRGAGRCPDVVLSSPRMRALQTAEEFCQAAEMPGPVVQAWLDCGMDPEVAIRELAAFADFERVMIVGHEPDFSTFTEWLLGCSGSWVEVKKGALLGMTVHPPAWHARLLFVIPPRLVGLP